MSCAADRASETSSGWVVDESVVGLIADLGEGWELSDRNADDDDGTSGEHDKLG